MSKNFPDSYEHNTNCEWNINVEEGQKIKLTFHLFNVNIPNQFGFYSTYSSRNVEISQKSISNIQQSK